MWYYEVWVASPAFHGDKPLTYSSQDELRVGSVVSVPLQRKKVLGIVAKEVTKPTFKTKELLLLEVTPILPEQIIGLIEWLLLYYPAPSGQIVSLFLPTNLDQKTRLQSAIKPKKNNGTQLPPLTTDQAKAVKIISRGKDRTFLLHGDTGTGKTRVYLEIAKDSLGQNKSVIILTPEIGLTPQLVSFFTSQLTHTVNVIHSHLTPAQKRNVWKEIALNSEAQVIIGPRSALFTPVKNIGLVVMDEMHDQAYKQEQAPRYQTSRVAAKLAQLHQALFIMGSATPQIADYYTMEQKKLPIIRMTEKAAHTDAKKTDITIVKASERENFTRSAWISDQLIKQIEQALTKKLQSLLFLNRRGSARAVICEACGWSALCPHCDLPLTYHGDSHRLRCHTCGFQTNAPTSCPECANIELSFRSVGTKAITEEIARLFPDAAIARFDSDNAKADSLGEQHTALQDGSIDILVGTQMLTKGLDLPRLSVIGILAADTSLFFPDYTAEELSFQQLSQVIGRVGRGHQEAHAIIQSYYPESTALQAAVDNNYSLFYSQQIIEREKFLFPPFSFVLVIKVSRKSSKFAEQAAQKIHTILSSLPLKIDVSVPTPCFQEKSHDQYHWQIVVKSKKRDQLLRIIPALPANTTYDLDPTNLL